jgi:hypothetical protein
MKAQLSILVVETAACSAQNERLKLNYMNSIVVGDWFNYIVAH